MVRESLSAWSGVCRLGIVAKVLMVNKVLDFIRVGEHCSISPFNDIRFSFCGHLVGCFMIGER